MESAPTGVTVVVGAPVLASNEPAVEAAVAAVVFPKVKSTPPVIFTCADAEPIAAIVANAQPVARTKFSEKLRNYQEKSVK